MGSSTSMTPSIFISAGEASGEFYGAELAAALSQNPSPKGKRAESGGWAGPGWRLPALSASCARKTWR